MISQQADSIETDSEQVDTERAGDLDVLRGQAIGWVLICCAVIVSSLWQNVRTTDGVTIHQVVDHGPMQISLNQTTLSEVSLLPGVGPKLAGRIIDYRDRRGGFDDLSELGEVPGIGPKTLQRLRPWLILDEP